MYGVLGGMPVYLQRGNDRLGHRANLQRLFADPTSPLVEEGQYVPPSELAEASGYFRILHAIAVGERTCGAIKEYTRIDIASQLERLLGIGLVEQVVPVTESRTHEASGLPHRGQCPRLLVRLVDRYRADIARDLGRRVVDRVIVRPGRLDGRAVEGDCRGGGFRSTPVDVSRVGRSWNRDNAVEIDIVGLRGTGGGARRAGALVTPACGSYGRSAAPSRCCPRRADGVHRSLSPARPVAHSNGLAFTFTGHGLYRRYAA